jgi:hypothetical protein
MNLYKQFKTDETLEKQGIQLSYGNNDNGEEILITISRAGSSNSNYTRVVEAKTKPYRRQIQAETLPRDVSDKIMREVYAESIVLGWSGVCDQDGNSLSFTKENVIKLFTDLPDLFEDVKEQANKASLFRSEEMSSDSKN